MNKRLSTTISGSFTFKEDIDEAIIEFGDYGVDVIAPEPGGVYIARKTLHRDTLAPLKSERGMSTYDIEQQFLNAISNSDFVYLFNPDGYIGVSSSFELGFTIGSGKPIYAKEEFDYSRAGYLDLDTIKLLKSVVSIIPIAEIPNDFKEKHQS